jgi:hypothetical protein
MARRILNRKELRNDYDAAERRKEEEETDEAQDEKEADADEEQDEDEDEDEAEEEAEGDEDGGEEDEEAPKKKKPPKAKPKPKPKAKPRTRTPKVTRMKVVWGVFNNSNARVATYEYPKRKEADDHAAKLTADKKSTHFVQPVKEPMEEKKEA